MSQNEYEFIDISNYSEIPYTNYTQTELIDTHLAIKKTYIDEDQVSNNAQYITYMDHPTIVVEEENEIEQENREQKDKMDLNIISQFYFGSLTVIGLFIVFRLLQLKK